MRTLESTIENAVVDWAVSRDWIHLKLNVRGRRGWPDQLFIRPGPKVVFIEFKRPGEKPRKLQSYIHSLLVSYGCHVYNVDSVAQGKETLKNYE